MTRWQRRTYTTKQKADAVRLVQGGMSISKVARDFDLPDSSLRGWEPREGNDPGPPGASRLHSRCGRQSTAIPRPRTPRLGNMKIGTLGSGSG